MRIHIYDEELPDRDGMELFVKKTAEGETYYGMRVWLKSAPELESRPDARSAVTFWAKASNRTRLKRLVGDMEEALQEGFQSLEPSET